MIDEKYIKRKLNNAIDDLAPDNLDEILASGYNKIDESDCEFGVEPLFEKKKNHNFKIFVPAAVMTLAVMVVLVMQLFNKPALNVSEPQNMACVITLDVNPSIDMVINAEGDVEKLKANNKDASKIVKKINKNIKDEKYKDQKIDTISKKIIKELKDNGYLKKKKTSAMLISTEKGEKAGEESIKIVRKAINKYKEENSQEFVTIYQEYEFSDNVKKVAEKNKVSPAKAAYCILVSEKSDAKVEKLCKETIADITKQVVKESIDLGVEVQIVEEVETNMDYLEEVTTEEESTGDIGFEETTTEEYTVNGEDATDKETSAQETESQDENPDSETTKSEETTDYDKDNVIK